MRILCHSYFLKFAKEVRLSPTSMSYTPHLSLETFSSFPGAYRKDVFSDWNCLHVRNVRSMSWLPIEHDLQRLFHREQCMKRIGAKSLVTVSCIVWLLSVVLRYDFVLYNSPRNQFPFVLLGAVFCRGESSISVFLLRKRLSGRWEILICFYLHQPSQNHRHIWCTAQRRAYRSQIDQVHSNTHWRKIDWLNCR